MAAHPHRSVRRAPAPRVRGDAWYASEEPTRRGLVRELQRLRRRSRARPLAVIALTAVLTAGVMARVITRERRLDAEVVLALSEGALAGERTGLRPDAIREYVTSKLLSDAHVLEVVEALDLYPLRHRLGPEFAVAELWDQVHVEVWRNSFAYYREEDAHARKAARIALTVTDSDPDRAVRIGRALAEVAIRAHQDERQRLAGQLTARATLMRDRMHERADDLTARISRAQAAAARAHATGDTRLAAGLTVDLAALDSELAQAEDALAQIAQSSEIVADAIAAAGLDLTLTLADERHPDRPTHVAFTLALIGVIVAAGALGASALLVGAFDPRIHDADDVARLGLPVLGHLPAFPGDHVGSLTARRLALRSPSRGEGRTR